MNINELETMSDEQIKKEGYVSLEEHLIDTVQQSNVCQALKTAIILKLRGSAGTRESSTVEDACEKYHVNTVHELITTIALLKK